MNHRRTDQDPQVTVEAKIKPTSTGTEILVFTIPMGPIEITCLANIPPDGEDKSSVYVKFKFKGLSTSIRSRANMEVFQE